ncbi:hypothetical protein BJV74DRAFT_152874 [Russula compacta]|nr:hypothetical protein BJV74DRAFT_152874 [Russula compacta]
MAQLEWSCQLPAKKEDNRSMGCASHVTRLTCHHQRYPSDYSYFPRTPVLPKFLSRGAVVTSQLPKHIFDFRSFRPSFGSSTRDDSIIIGVLNGLISRDKFVPPPDCGKYSDPSTPRGQHEAWEPALPIHGLTVFHTTLNNTKNRLCNSFRKMSLERHDQCRLPSHPLLERLPCLNLVLASFLEAVT